ncbi:MAG: radical SAM protein [Candidatus Heimdallarchaeaceae archaeon]
MITSTSKRMMCKSFEKTRYSYRSIPQASLHGSFGVYIHVPFCYSKCSFCPFYKEIFSEKAKNEYLAALLKEIETTDMTGKAHWVYFGGGTPNTLSIQELKSIGDLLKSKIQVESVGIELLPSILEKKYLQGLKRIGFTKISIGIESLSKKTLTKTGRKVTTFEHISEIVQEAKSLGLWVNVDIMVGLPEQSPEIFMDDIQQIININPSQVTIYPFMQIGEVQVVPSLAEIEQFELIEKANLKLTKAGFTRKGIWVFSQGNDIYDSSRDELIEDYIGFGPAAFSTFGDVKVVNPELDIYLHNFQENRRLALVAQKDKTSDDWRKFARMIYDLKGSIRENISVFIKIYIFLLKLTGYIRKGTLTKKGIFFAHAITKTVVENLPFPLQNTNYIENFD